jgi:AcrR family transcriptional regulator
MVLVGQEGLKRRGMSLDGEMAGRQLAAGRPEQAAAGRPEQAAAGRPEQAAAGRPEQAAAGRPEQAAAGRREQAAAGRREQAVVDREQAAAGRREQILGAALAIADEKGLDAVTMRAVAARIGVTAMALYPHVRSKDDLLDGLVGRLLAELSRPDPAQPWADRLRALGRSARELAHRHPAVVPLLFARPAVTPDAVLVVDAIYQALLDAGVPEGEVARVERMISTFVLGYAISETGGRFAVGDPRERRALLRGVELPAHQRLASLLETTESMDAEFEADMDDLVRMVENVAAAPPARQREPAGGRGTTVRSAEKNLLPTEGQVRM